MRVHVAPAFPGDPPHPQHDWFVSKMSSLSGTRFELVGNPEAADVILLTDLGSTVSHARFSGRVFQLLTNPLLLRYRERTFVYHEQDVPRPYLPGLYSYLEWFPHFGRYAVSVAPAESLQGAPNVAVDDAEPPGRRDVLFSFVGRDCHPVRTRLLQLRNRRADVVLIDSGATYDHYGETRDVDKQLEFVRIMRRSRWAICPRGWSTGSRRLFESMRLGVAPVIVSDRWMPPPGPDWDSCVYWVAEDQVSELPEILEARGDEWRRIGAAARDAYESFFAPSVVCEHNLGCLETLAELWQSQLMLGVTLRQWRECVYHAIGFTSPVLAHARRQSRL